ncbi:MAG TPA: hypothetical protein VF756_07445 [Thermoanaerobaculia bacterium]
MKLKVAAPLTLLSLALYASGPAPAAEPPSLGPRVVVLGTAQDGGAPDGGASRFVTLSGGEAGGGHGFPSSTGAPSM